MNPDDQRIAIAKACGWVMHTRSNWEHPSGYLRVNWGGELSCPDYLNDLNEMHEAEKMLVGWLGNSTVRFSLDGYRSYVAMLFRVVNGLPDDAYYHWSDLGAEESIVSASAAQRAEAFLRTLSLWSD